ncbi:M3 family oligoendopeptidase [Entomospira entomophila]|uniref:M3 family oligoendopeptidase n=1 Tax=Entomospira entomophila TaxID=2719988 RepID=A0A968G9G7_9SPIO|nr:M3 family oligoendopeptidase [Entomospira entomophilus]NIZ41043.1 M3 family oligoendopeptidase [Entomospira entomophilus]WDI35252.1 M3 family oligoendopeptidase [Entomospira entomophilus]
MKERIHHAIRQAFLEEDLAKGKVDRKRWRLIFILISFVFVFTPFFVDKLGINSHVSQRYWLNLVSQLQDDIEVAKINIDMAKSIYDNAETDEDKAMYKGVLEENIKTLAELEKNLDEAISHLSHASHVSQRYWLNLVSQLQDDIEEMKGRVGIAQLAYDSALTDEDRAKYKKILDKDTLRSAVLEERLDEAISHLSHTNRKQLDQIHQLDRAVID